MKYNLSMRQCLAIFLLTTGIAVSEVELAKPSDAQYVYHELERIMFVCLDPCTWQGREYDNHSTDLKELMLPKLDVDQWCEAAKSWDAKEILFVAKHTGGFCWWQTATTEYSVKNIAWKNGKGDLLTEVAEACKRHGLKLGIYIYPGDDQWGAGIGSGGKTGDPSKQEAYNQVLRTQWAEVLSRHSENVIELWFDGNCHVPLGDIFEKYVGDRVVYFQGPHASLRWVGTESGMAPYPAWNTLKKEHLQNGGATALHGDPDGDAWAPLECDTTLYDHYWFWAKEKEKTRKSLEHLVRLYYQSVGRGATFLLNSTPNTDGLIPEGDMALYKAFGDELKCRFSQPLGEAKGTGSIHTVRLDKPTAINQVVIMEDYRQGHRIREFVVEGRTVDGQWIDLHRGTAVGRKRIILFEPVEVTAVTLRVTKHVNEPLLRNFKVYFVKGDNQSLYESRVRENVVSLHAKATASDVHSPPYSADKICDGKETTWWGVSPRMKAPYDCWVELDLGKAQAVHGTRINEPWNRTEAFQLEYRNDPKEQWKLAFRGDKMGAAFSGEFDEIIARYWRLHTLKANHDPAIKEWSLIGPRETAPWQKVGIVRVEKDPASLDLTEYIPRPGQYLIRFDDIGGGGGKVAAIEAFFDGNKVHEKIITPIKKGEMVLLNRQSQVMDESTTTLNVLFAAQDPKASAIEVFIKPAL